MLNLCRLLKGLFSQKNKWQVWNHYVNIKLRNTPEDEHTRRFLQIFYVNSTRVIRLRKDTENRCRDGLQVDSVSPKLFTSCLENVFKKSSRENKGINTKGEYLKHLTISDIVQVNVPHTLLILQLILVNLGSAWAALVLPKTASSQTVL